MFEVFKSFGLVVEVVIPPRRDKCSKRYGFVRFRKVENERIMAVKLNNIIIQGKKIYANVPRFQCDFTNAQSNEMRSRIMENRGRSINYQHGNDVRNLRSKKISYAQVVGGRNVGGGRNGAEPRQI
ncbi:unnamed protein product [Lathyrus sativus]|nr:unnamed protein product [Lathyrus sativus]